MDTEWTVMAYLAGDNNLNEEMVLTLQEMLALDVWDRVKIYAQLDPSALGLPTQRYVFDPADKDAEKLHYLDTYRVDFDGDWEANTGNPTALSGFAKWAIADPPSENHHALIVSGHGSGSTEDFLAKDQNPVDSLSIPEFAEALSDIRDTLGEDRKIDLLGMDCCFMSMVEVYYEIRDYVKRAVAAESFVPDFGWPYNRILRRAEDLRWFEVDPDTSPPAVHGIVTPQELGEIMVEQYIDFYSDYDRTAGRSVDLACIYLPQISALKDAIDALGKALRNAIETDPEIEPEFRHKICTEQIVLAHWESQTYKSDQFVDIRDFCRRISERFSTLTDQLEAMGVDVPEELATTISSIVGKSDDVVAAVDTCVEISGCSGFAYQHSYGLSVYFPWAYVSDSYTTLGFARKKNNQNKDGGWLKFLKRYVARTKREPRDEGDVEMVPISPTEEDDAQGELEAALDTLIESWGDDKKTEVAKSHWKCAAGISHFGTGGEFSGGSKYHRSRYHRSRYHRSRWPGDREKSVKNFTPLVGTAYIPEKPNVFDEEIPE